MRFGLAALAAATVLSWASCAVGQAPGPEVFGAIPAIAGLDLSADGDEIILLAPDGDVMTAAIASVSAEGLGPQRLLHRPGGTAELVGAEWIDETYAILWEIDALPMPGGLGPDRLDMIRALSLHVPTGQLAPLLPERTADGWNVVAPQQIGRGGPRPGVARFATYDTTLAAMLFGDPTGKPPVFVVYEIDLATGAGKIVERGGVNTRGWGADHEGRLRLRYEVDPVSNAEVTYIRDDEQSPYRVLVRWDAFMDAEWELAGFDAADPNQVFVSGHFGEDLLQVRMLDLVTGALGATVFAQPHHDVSGVMSENWTGLAVGFAWTDTAPRESYFHPVWARVQALADAQFPGAIVSFPVEAEDRSAVVVRVSAPDDPASYYHLSVEIGAFAHLYDEYPALEGAVLGTVENITYTTRDGAAIPAYLTLPPGGRRAHLPTIIMPHGGPHARDSGDFDWWAQFLASRGYAVFQPQFRGSTGFGQAFERAGWRQWGGLMQDDVTDGVQWLVSQGIADPSRICIVGASYGGYAALAGATQTPELYRCVVSVAGVADIALMVDQDLHSLQSDPLTEDWLRAAVFEDLSDRRGMARISPAANAARVQAPILLMHGRDDTVVPFRQSQAMAEALARAGKPYELITLPGEDHYLSTASTRIAMLAQLERFLAAHLGPGVAP
jgi:dipeptidyl aminopeptidase/acylaminoacyl peptidase